MEVCIVEEFEPIMKFSFDKMFDVYFDWVNKMSKLDEESLEQYKERLFITYDSIESFFKTWMKDNSENRRRYFKLLANILKLV